MKKYHDYVKEQRRNGHSYLDIFRHLRRYNYPYSLIMKIFLTMDVGKVFLSVFVSVIVVIGIGASIFYTMNASHKYVLEVGNEDDDRGVLYVVRGFGEPSLGLITGRTTDERFDFGFSPDSYLDINEGYFSMIFDTDGDINIWDNGWVTFYKAKWKNFEKVAQFGDDVVYADCSKVNCNFLEAGSLLEWVNNLPKYYSVYFYDDQFTAEDFTNAVTDFAGRTEIDTFLRGKHVFLAYLDDVVLDVTKQDLNWYENEDILKISIETLDGVKLLEGVIDDDGIFYKGSQGALQVKRFTAQLDPGVYRLVFDVNDDSTFKFTINTKKLVVEGRAFPLGSVRFFYGGNPREVTVVTWHKEGLQKLTGEDLLVDINEVGVRYNLTFNDYTLAVPEGDVILNNVFFAFTQEGYFEPYRYILEDDADIVVMNKVNNVKGAMRKKITPADRIRFESSSKVVVEKAILEVK